MPDSWHTRHNPAPRIVTAASNRLADLPANLSAMVFQNQTWQEEAWQYWRNLGELNFGITWLANSLSQVRLNAAELVPGGDEPAVLTEGPAAELMQAFCGGIAGQGAFMTAMGYQLGVPGEGWMVVERGDESVPLEQATWRVVPNTAIRRENGQRAKVRVGENIWRPIADEGFAGRIFKEDPQYPWRSWSPVQAALPNLRRIDLIDRRIVAVLVSRLAMNGLLLIPQEGTFEVPDKYKQAADPFGAMLLEAAGINIKMPGAASAAIPLIVKYTAELIEKWRLLTWDQVLPQELIEKRDKEISSLATTLAMPKEVLTGMGDVNHWGAWQLDESGQKTAIAPYSEVIAGGVSDIYLWPLMKQLGEKPVGPNGGKIITWYDLSQLAARPDKSANTVQAYDRGEASGEALRREFGLDEADAPDKTQLEHQLLLKLAGQPQTASAAFAALTGNQLAISGTPPTQTPASGIDVNGPDAGAGPPATTEQRTMPATQENPPPPPGPEVVAGLRIGRPRPHHVNGVR